MEETNFNTTGNLIRVTKTRTIAKSRDGFVLQCVAVELLATVFTVSGKTYL